MPWQVGRSNHRVEAYLHIVVWLGSGNYCSGLYVYVGDIVIAALQLPVPFHESSNVRLRGPLFHISLSLHCIYRILLNLLRLFFALVFFCCTCTIITYIVYTCMYVLLSYMYTCVWPTQEHSYISVLCVHVRVQAEDWQFQDRATRSVPWKG